MTEIKSDQQSIDQERERAANLRWKSGPYADYADEGLTPRQIQAIVPLLCKARCAGLMQAAAACEYELADDRIGYPARVLLTDLLEKIRKQAAILEAAVESNKNA